MRKTLISLFVFLFMFSNSLVLAQAEQTTFEDDIQVVQSETVDTNETVNNEQENDIDKLNEEMGLGEQRQIVIDDVQSSPNDNKALTKKVVPDTRSELTKMVKMFLKVMLAVAISSVVIFVVLLFVRRFYAPMVTLEDLNADEDKKITLDTPQNKNEALKTFLDKTKEM